MIGSARKHVIALAAAALVAVAVSACGGGGNGPTNGPTIMYIDVDLSDLMDDLDATAGTITIKAGEHADRGDIRFQCAAGGEDCVVKVAVGGDGITAMYRSPGGRVTAEDVPPMYDPVDLSDLKSDYDAAAGRIEIEAGADEDHGDIRFSCAAGGDDCVVMVMVADNGTITAQALATGGMVTAVDATVDVDLSSLKPGYDADAVTLEIDAGADVDHGDIRFSCASGPDDCLVMVMVAGDGTITAWARPSGGTVTAGDATVDVDLKDVTVGFWAEAIMMLEIVQDTSETHGDILFECAAGRYDCTVMVMVADDGTITATSIGGEVTASDAGEPNTLVDTRLDEGINRGS